MQHCRLYLHCFNCHHKPLCTTGISLIFFGCIHSQEEKHCLQKQYQGAVTKLQLLVIKVKDSSALPNPPSSSLSRSLYPFRPPSPTSSPLPLFIGMAIFQMFNRFAKIIPSRGIYSIGIRRGGRTSREQSHKLNIASLRHASPGRAQSHNFLPIPPFLPMPRLLPNGILFSERLPWPVGPSATTEVAPAGIQAWNYERMGLPLPPVVHWPQMWNCRFFLPPRTGLSHAGRKRLYLSPVRICQNWVTWGRTA